MGLITVAKKQFQNTIGLYKVPNFYMFTIEYSFMINHPKHLIFLAKERFYSEKMPLHVSTLPSIIDIEPTTRCNLKCGMCQTTYWDRTSDDLSYEHFKLIVDQFPSLKDIKLQGMGEPLLNKDFFRMVKYAGSKGIKTRTISNGTLIDDRLASRIISSELTQIHISLDGASSQTYENIRKGASFDATVANIARLTEARGDLKKPFIGVWVVGMMENIHELPEIIGLCSKLQVDQVTLQHDLIFWGKDHCWNKLKDRRLDTKVTATENIIEESKKIAEKLGLDFNVHVGDKYSNQNGRKCRWPWSSCYITADGYVEPCCLVNDPGLINFGNVFKDDFGEIWNNSKYREFRAQIKDGKLHDVCKYCYS